MILLVSASDALRLVTSSAANIAVQASYVDLSGSTVTPGRQNTAIAAATTTQIVPGPSSGARTVKTLTVVNTHASTANTVTVEHTDGTTPVRLFSIVLAAGESLQYHEGAGFLVYDAVGRAKTNSAAGGSAVAVGALTAVALSADVTNGSVNVWSDITGLSFDVTAGETYFFELFLLIASTATGTGFHVSMSGPSAPTRFGYLNLIPTGATATTISAYNTYSQPAAALANVPYTADNVSLLTGFVRPSVNGTMQARILAEAASITVREGSLLRWLRTR